MQITFVIDDQNPHDLESLDSLLAVLKSRQISGQSGLAATQEEPLGDGAQGQTGEPSEDYREKVQAIAALECGRLIRGALEHFPAEQFDIKQLAPLISEEVATVHSWAAQLGKSCKHRGVEVFARHGGTPLKLSILPEARQVLTQTDPPVEPTA